MDPARPVNRKSPEPEELEDALDSGAQTVPAGGESRNARMGLPGQSAKEKRRLLKTVLSNCPWIDGQLGAECRQAFDLSAVAAFKPVAGGGR